MSEAFHHRPTLKQQNKPFKSKHATKSALKERAKGRVQRESPKTAQNGSAAAAQKRLNRRNAAKQAQLNKRHTLVNATRIFNGVNGTPRIVAVISLCEDLDVKETVVRLAESLGVDTSGIPDHGLWTMRVERFKTSLQFIMLPYGLFYETLDAAKVADYAMLLLSSSVEVTSWGDTLLRTLQAQGFPSTVTALAPSTSKTAQMNKEQVHVLKSLLSFIKYFIPSQSRVFNLETDSSASDALNATRALCEGRPAEVRWRQSRPYVLAEDVSWLPDEEGDSPSGTLRVTGVIRGAPLSAERLVHLPNYGDFQIAKITSAALMAGRAGPVANEMNMDAEPIETVLVERNASSADSLISTNEVNDMTNEQTWPTEEEMNQETLALDDGDHPDAAEGTTPKRVKRVPKGTSEYQAAWIIDEEDDADSDAGGSQGGDDDAAMDDGESLDAFSRDPAGLDSDGVEEEEEEDLVPDPKSGAKVTFEDMDMEEESKQLDSWRKRSRDEAEDAMFPDEIDTPQDMDARTRFQRFRGLQSFRTSPWDPFENLPRDYARIFQFQDYKRSEHNAFKHNEDYEHAVPPGTRVCIHVTKFPSIKTSQLLSCKTLFGLLKHEHKMSVQNFRVQRDTNYEKPVRSKDPLILCVGPRRLAVNPIYSQHTRGGGKGVNNVHKFERFLRPGAAHVSTIYAPIFFGQQSCILLKENADVNAPSLVASGTFMNPDTTRIIAKRIILTGHPFKVHKRTATVRYMFFNPEDVTYFAPVQLHTKYGRVGHIKESLGTHGYFKAHFDGPITQMDTICMSLYKRVYPKWAQLWKQKGLENTVNRQGDAMEE